MHIGASRSRQPLVQGERLVRCEVNAVMETSELACGRWKTACNTIYIHLYLNIKILIKQKMNI